MATTSEAEVASWFEVFGLHDPDRLRGVYDWRVTDSGSTVERLGCIQCGVTLLDVATHEARGGHVTFEVLDSLLRLHYVLSFEVESRAGESWS